MKIGTENYEAVIVMNNDREPLAVVSDTEIVEKDGIIVECVPCKNTLNQIREETEMNELINTFFHSPILLFNSHISEVTPGFTEQLRL